MTSALQEAVFVGANKQAHTLDYSLKSGVTAFGASTTVALWRPFSANGVYATLKAHTKEVTGVKFVPGTNLLVSTGEDGLIAVWRGVEESNTPPTYELVQSLNHHVGSITAVATSHGFVVTGGVDGNVVIWKVSEKDGETPLQLLKSFTVQRGFFPTCLALQDVYGETMLAVGGTSSVVYLYDVNTDTQNRVALSGHEDWIKCLAWTKDNQGYLLALGGQDRYIRLWRVCRETPKDQVDETKLVLLANKKEYMKLGNEETSSCSVEIYFDALIMGHDDWVTGLVWRPEEGQLLSLSADTGLMIWEMDTVSGIWCCISRLGEMSIKGASTATGSSGGFWSCLWIEQELGGQQYILANGKTGSFRVYKRDGSGSDKMNWSVSLGITGPSKEVTDLVWSPNGNYFYATSLDQTTRLFAKSKSRGWRELARPQIHGYDMICMDNLDGTKFVSGGDEKVLRVFEMTGATADVLEREGIEVGRGESKLPETAALPVLGLSNKADNEESEVKSTENEKEDEQEDKPSKDETVASSTESVEELIDINEDLLQRHTLYPEIEKLYGHGYELTSCATSPTHIASSCRSNSTRHAAIRVFTTTDYQMSHVLEAHSLTVTSLAFSPDNKYLLAVSRDRQLSLWKDFKLVVLQQAHSRIVWDCAWLDNTHFITGSRDKLIKIWKVLAEGVELLATEKLSLPVSSVATYQKGLEYYLAIGLEDGISVFRTNVQTDTVKVEPVVEFESTITPAGRVAKVAWGAGHGDELVLAVGSADTSVRVYTVCV